MLGEARDTVRVPTISNLVSMGKYLKYVSKLPCAKGSMSLAVKGMLTCMPLVHAEQTGTCQSAFILIQVYHWIGSADLVCSESTQ